MEDGSFTMGTVVTKGMVMYMAVQHQGHETALQCWFMNNNVSYYNLVGSPHHHQICCLTIQPFPISAPIVRGGHDTLLLVHLPSQQNQGLFTSPFLETPSTCSKTLYQCLHLLLASTVLEFSSPNHPTVAPTTSAVPQQV
jgi:hypothetical protein